MALRDASWRLGAVVFAYIFSELTPDILSQKNEIKNDLCFQVGLTYRTLCIYSMAPYPFVEL